MYAVPDVDEVVAVAKELGIRLGPDEAALYQKYLIEQLREIRHLCGGAFGGAQAAAALGSPTTWVPAEAEEDPLNAW
jgi:hypothetical protein